MRRHTLPAGVIAPCPAMAVPQTAGNFRRGRRCIGMASEQAAVVQQCLSNATCCEKRAAAARDPTAKASFVEAARCWREFARRWGELQIQSKNPACQANDAADVGCKPT